MKFKKRNLEIKLDGKDLVDFGLDISDIAVNQHLGKPQHFEVALVTGMEDLQKDREYNYIGKTIDICFGAQSLSGKSNTFRGIITNVRSFKEHASKRHLFFTGYSPDYLMNANKYTRAFIGKPLQAIVAEITKDYDAGLINFRNNPKFKLVIPYIIQYNETDYEFIKRLASQFGEWFYFDGDRFVFGEHQKGKKSELRLKENLLRIELNLNIVPIPDPIQMYNYNETQPYKKDKVNYPNIDSEDAIKTLNKSNQLFNSQHKKAYHSISELQAESQQVLDHYGDSIAGKGANDLANITGISDAFGISVGSSVKWLDRNMIEEVDRGEYVVIEANHTVNKNGDYRVNFKGVPAGNEFPPNDHQVKIPKATPEIGTVIDNHDDKGLGRVRVKFHWMDGHQTTLWIRLSAAGAGAGRGFYFVPEVGDEVIVGYEHGNPDMPFVMGTTYNAHTAPGSKSSAGNDIKGLMTRTGHTIELNDGSSPGITIKDSGGNCINIDCSSNTVTITSMGDLNLVAEANMNLMAKGDIQLNAKQNVKVSAAENNVEITAMENVEATATKDMVLIATKNIQVNADESIRLEAVQKLNMRGDAKAAIRSSGNIVIDSGANTHVSGASNVFVKGGEVHINKG